MATDPPLDFWPVDPSTLEDDNPLLRHDYAVVIGLNLVSGGGVCLCVCLLWGVCVYKYVATKTPVRPTHN